MQRIIPASSCSTNSKSERRKENFDLNVEPPEKLHLSSLNARCLHIVRLMMNTHSERYLCPLSGNSLIVTPQPANPMFGAVYRQHYTCRLLGAGVNQILYFFSFYNVPRLTFVASFLCPQINRQLTIQSWYKSNMQSHYLASFNSLKTKLMTLPDLPSFIVQSQ